MTLKGLSAVLKGYRWCGTVWCECLRPRTPSLLSPAQSIRTDSWAVDEGRSSSCAKSCSKVYSGIPITSAAATTTCRRLTQSSKALCARPMSATTRRERHCSFRQPWRFAACSAASVSTKSHRSNGLQERPCRSSSQSNKGKSKRTSGAHNQQGDIEGNRIPRRGCTSPRQ